MNRFLQVLSNVSFYLVFVCVLVTPGFAEESSYLRLKSDSHNRPEALETAIVRFVPQNAKADPITVDLVGAVHVGDASYYDELNEKFKGYDALLYELVAPEGHEVPGHREPSNNPLSAIQRTMKNALELEFQLDRVNYKAPNFVHADMSPEQFVASMVNKGESIWAMLARLLIAGYARQAEKGTSSDLGLMIALVSPNRSLALKRLLAREFLDMDLISNALNGPEGSTIITERNKAALAVLKRELGNGKKHFGIFYGAAHLSDMEQRLQSDFGLRRASVDWVEAWNLRKE